MDFNQSCLAELPKAVYTRGNLSAIASGLDAFPVRSWLWIYDLAGCAGLAWHILKTLHQLLSARRDSKGQQKFHLKCSCNDLCLPFCWEFVRRHHAWFLNRAPSNVR